MAAGPGRDTLSPFQPSKDAFTYERFFGLREKAFSLSSDPRFLYASPSHAAAYDDLLAGIRRREGLLVLTGDIGTGKTTLCRAVLRDLDRKTFSAFVPDPFASREDLLKMLLIEFGVMSIQDITTGPLKNASRTELSYLLSAFLESLAPLEAFVVMFIDEAQNMSLPLIEEVRILSDSHGEKGQLQVVFVGQLELHDKLKLAEMRQVDQRVCVYGRLEPLSPDALAGYVKHRLNVAGASGDRVMFLPDCFVPLYAASQGVPRVINRICDRALHLAYQRRASSIDRKIIEDATADVGQPVGAAQVPVIESEVPALSPEGQNFAARIDEWLTRAEINPHVPATAPAVLEGASGTAPAQPASSPPPAPERHVVWRHEIDGYLRGQTYMQRLTRRWLRRAVVIAGWLVALTLLQFGAGRVIADLWSEDTGALPIVADAPTVVVPSQAFAVAPPPPAETRPVVEPAPVSGEYHIAVALFTTAERAARVVSDLAQSGFPARTRRLTVGPHRVFEQVLLGPYVSRERAEADLERLHQTHGFTDARIY